MAYTVAHIKIPDFNTWKPVFDSLAEVRARYGCRGGQVLRSLDDPNEVVIVLNWDNDQGPRDFLALPEVREGFKRGGVTIVATVITEEVDRPAQ